GGLEGRALRRGDVLHALLPSCPPATLVGRRLPSDPERQLPGADMTTLRVLPGPGTLETPDTLLTGCYTVDPRSDRMGVRLRYQEQEGPPLRGGQILSEGVPRGAVQVPPGGEPIVLLADAQTTGGYTVPAVVIAADHWRAAQLRPGAVVRFALVTEEQALAALRARRLWMDQLAAGGFAREHPGAVDLAALMRGFAEWSEAADL